MTDIVRGSQDNHKSCFSCMSLKLFNDRLSAVWHLRENDRVSTGQCFYRSFDFIESSEIMSRGQ